MNPAEFIDKWKKAALTERSAAQQHFLDLCELMDHPKPAEVDPTGEFFTFEKGATKKDGSDGWADVWKRGYFAFGYKGKHKDLDAAYRQLDDYRALAPLGAAPCRMSRGHTGRRSMTAVTRGFVQPRCADGPGRGRA